MYDDNDGCLVFLIPVVILIVCFGIFFDWHDDEDGAAFRCGRCDDQTIMLDGEPPFYCPRCGVGFTAYMCMGRRYPFRDDGTVDYEDVANR